MFLQVLRFLKRCQVGFEIGNFANSCHFPPGRHVHAAAVRRLPSVGISKWFCRRLRLLPKPPTVKTFPGSPQVAPPNSAGKVTPPAREMVPEIRKSRKLYGNHEKSCKIVVKTKLFWGGPKSLGNRVRQGGAPGGPQWSAVARSSAGESLPWGK